MDLISKHSYAQAYLNTKHLYFVSFNIYFINKNQTCEWLKKDKATFWSSST